jgi:hypothetical protein
MHNKACIHDYYGCFYSVHFCDFVFINDSFELARKMEGVNCFSCIEIMLLETMQFF